VQETVIYADSQSESKQELLFGIGANWIIAIFKKAK
jgi:hypothetical protein